MQYSSVSGHKVLPYPKAKGQCEVCGAETLAKCGEKIMWHWAHKSKMECDPWWENETEWHREWKEKFPENFREIVHTCSTTGEKHRADIKSDKGIILEVQNSPISLEELRSRENFYKNLVWIVNGEKFRSRFKVWKAPLPNPLASGFEDIVFIASKYESSCSMFTRKSGKWPMTQIFSTREIQKQIHEHYIGHHSFHWVRPHVAWLEAKCPVFIDFGTDLLWKLESYRDQFRCVKAVSKEVVISNIINEGRDTAVLAIAEKLLSFEQIKDALNRYKWDVFERLKIFIASEFPEKALGTVSLMLLSGENQEKHSREKEYMGDY